MIFPLPEVNNNTQKEFDKTNNLIIEKQGKHIISIINTLVC